MLSTLIADTFALIAVALIYVLWKDTHEEIMKELEKLEAGI